MALKCFMLIPKQPSSVAKVILMAFLCVYYIVSVYDLMNDDSQANEN